MDYFPIRCRPKLSMTIPRPTPLHKLAEKRWCSTWIPSSKCSAFRSRMSCNGSRTTRTLTTWTIACPWHLRTLRDRKTKGPWHVGKHQWLIFIQIEEICNTKRSGFALFHSLYRLLQLLGRHTVDKVVVCVHHDSYYYFYYISVYLLHTSSFLSYSE